MKLIVGLGNPGKEYRRTRHNMGFRMIDSFLEKYPLALKKKKFQGEYVEITIASEKVILLEPQSYMNLSGEVVRNFVGYFKIPLEDVLIICDDISLDLGNYRLRAQGTCSGHNGLRNIEENLKTRNYRRLRIGVARNEKIELKDYVLGKLSKEEEQVIANITPTIHKIIEQFVTEDFTWMMTYYNHKNR